MKKVIVAMLLMSVFLIGGGGFISMVISSMIGGGIEQSFIYPLYAGIIILTGVVVGVTEVILSEIRELKEMMKNIRNHER